MRKVERLYNKNLISTQEERRMKRHNKWKPEAGSKSVLRSPLEGAPIIKKDFREGKILAHDYAGIFWGGPFCPITRADVEYYEEFGIFLNKKV